MKPEVDHAEQLRVELQHAIWNYLGRMNGFAPAIEIREWRPIANAWAPSLEGSFGGELFFSYRRSADAASHEALETARDRLRNGLERGLVDERLKHADIAETPPGVFNEGQTLITLGVILRVHI